MIKRLLTYRSRSITGAAIILGAASFVSRLIGVMRDRIFAHYFGAGQTLDAYYAAFRIPDLVYNLLIVGALSAGFIPVFMELLTKDKREAWLVTNGMLNIISVVTLAVCGILFLFTPKIVPVIVPGFDGEALRTTILLTRIMFLSPILLGISSLVSGVLQSFKSFFIYSLTPIMYNVGIIVGALFFVPVVGVAGLGFGVILGALLHLAIQLPMLFRLGFRYRPILALKNSFVRRIAGLMIPRTLGLATTQLNLVAMTTIASTLEVGSIAIFNFANNLQYVPIGIIGISFAIAAFPTLSESIARKHTQDAVRYLSHTMRQILFFIIPCTIIVLLLRAQIVRVVLGTGAFDWNATIVTARTLAFFALSLFAQCLLPLLARGFYALQDTWTPFLSSLATTLMTILAALYYKDIYGISGIALAFSIAMIAQLAILWLILRQKLGTLDEGRIVRSLIKISAAAVLMALSIQLLKAPLARIVDMTRFWGILTQGFLSGTIGLLVYGLVCYALHLEEMLAFQKSFKKRWLKLKHYQGEINEADEI